MTNRDQDLIERLTLPVSESMFVRKSDMLRTLFAERSEAATALASSATRIAELEARLEAAPSPSPAPGVVTDDGLDQFTAYFVKNYPGPETIIHDPKWHAPRIFRAAKAASLSQPAKGEQS